MNMQILFRYLALALIFLSGIVGTPIGEDARYEVDRARLADGVNLIYAVFGESLTTLSGIPSVLSNLQVKDSAIVVSIDAVEYSAMESLSAIKQLQDRVKLSSYYKQSAALERQIVILVQNLDNLQSRDQLLHLDFLFRLPDKAYDSCSLIVLLLWDTAKIQVPSPSAMNTEVLGSSDDIVVVEDERIGDFWNWPDADRQWRDNVRALWKAAGPEFNVDAAIGRMSRVIFFPSHASPVNSAATSEASHSPVYKTILEEIQESQTARVHLSMDSAVLPKFITSLLQSLKIWMLSVQIASAVRIVLIALLGLFIVLLSRPAFEALNSPLQQEYTKHVHAVKASPAYVQYHKEQEQKLDQCR